MKRWKAVLMACLLCTVVACSGVNNAANNMAIPDTVKNTMLLPPDTEPEYELTPLTEKKSYTAEDGTVLAECSYALLTLHVRTSCQRELPSRPNRRLRTLMNG